MAIIRQQGEAPAIQRRWSWIWEAWLALASSRPLVGRGLGGALWPLPLPWAVVEDYAVRTGCGRGERRTLHRVLTALDREFLAQRHAAIEAAMQGGS